MVNFHWEVPDEILEGYKNGTNNTYFFVTGVGDSGNYKVYTRYILHHRTYCSNKYNNYLQEKV